MPSASITLPDIEQSVTRPLIFSILEQVFEITHMSKDTEIYYAGKRGTMSTPGTNIDDSSKDARFGANRYTFVEVDESYNIEAMQEIHIAAAEHAPVFSDVALGLSLRPIYTTSDVTINIRYRSNSETEVSRWMAEMLLRTAAGREMNLHSVSYTYPIPYPFLGLIEHVWELREGIDGYSEPFIEYVAKHSTDRLCLLSNRAGEQRHLAIRERQSRIQGRFDFVGVPDKPTRDDKTGTWELSFGYKFSYQRPDAVHVYYPVIVHNQLLDEKYLDFKQYEEDPETRLKRYSKSYEALSLFEGDQNALRTRPPYPYIRIPDFDDYSLDRKIPQGTATIFTALCALDEGKKELLSLFDIDEYDIHEDLVDYLIAETPWLTRPYASFYNLTLLKNDRSVLWEKVEVDQNLTFSSKEPLSYRDNHRVRFSLVIDMSLLDWEAFLRLSKYPKAFVLTLSSVSELLRSNPDFQDLKNAMSLKDWQLSLAWWIINRGQKSNWKDLYTWNDIFSSVETNAWTNERPYRGRTPTSSKNQKTPYWGLRRDDISNDWRRVNQPTVMFGGIVAQRKSLLEGKEGVTIA